MKNSARDVWGLWAPGIPDDIARVVLCRASDLSAFMTGSTLLADGGSTA
ncbi:hypothetical protein ACIBG0_25860 [Nocardia sp. NPDC050630]